MDKLHISTHDTEPTGVINRIETAIKFRRLANTDINFEHWAGLSDERVFEILDSLARNHGVTLHDVVVWNEGGEEDEI